MARPKKPAPDLRDLQQEAEGRYEPFLFIGLDGESYELPNPQLMSPEDIRVALEVPDREADDFDLQDWAPRDLMMALSPDAWRALRQAPGYAQTKVLDDWVDHCEIELDEGKEPSASSATNRRARRSKRT